MKKLSFFMLLSLAAAASFAQESFQVTLHKKILVSTNTPGTAQQVKLIKSTDWKKNGYLEVKYQPAAKNEGWSQKLQFADEKGNMILQKDSSAAKISTQSLRQLFAGKKEIVISIIIAPSDPMIMAPAKMKQLATLKLP